MNTIVKEEAVSFKELEKRIFAYACELAREITVQILENYDQGLAEGRDKKQYRCKGKRQTSIKTVYGEVEYQRNVYRTETEDGRTAHIFLLDEAMQMQETVESLSAAKAPKKDGKGNIYVDLMNHHMPILDAMQTVSRKAFRRAFGY